LPPNRPHGTASTPGVLSGFFDGATGPTGIPPAARSGSTLRGQLYILVVQGDARRSVAAKVDAEKLAALKAEVLWIFVLAGNKKRGMARPRHGDPIRGTAIADPARADDRDAGPRAQWGLGLLLMLGGRQRFAPRGGNSLMLSFEGGGKGGGGEIRKGVEVVQRGFLCPGFWHSRLATGFRAWAQDIRRSKKTRQRTPTRHR